MTTRYKKGKIEYKLLSLAAIIIVLSSSVVLYGKDNLTGSVAVEFERTPSLTREAKDISSLSQLNEGWYEISQGYVFYLEHFDSKIPLFVRIQNPEQQNGIVIVDDNGNVHFDKTFSGMVENKPAEETDEGLNGITGKVTGLERVTGMQTAKLAQSNLLYVDGRYYQYQYGYWVSSEFRPPLTKFQVADIGNDFNTGFEYLISKIDSGKGIFKTKKNLIIYNKNFLEVGRITSKEYEDALSQMRDKKGEYYDKAKGSASDEAVQPRSQVGDDSAPTGARKADAASRTDGARPAAAAATKKNTVNLEIRNKEGVLGVINVESTKKDDYINYYNLIGATAVVTQIAPTTAAASGLKLEQNLPGGVTGLLYNGVLKQIFDPQKEKDKIDDMQIELVKINDLQKIEGNNRLSYEEILKFVYPEEGAYNDGATKDKLLQAIGLSSAVQAQSQAEPRPITIIRNGKPVIIGYLNVPGIDDRASVDQYNSWKENARKENALKALTGAKEIGVTPKGEPIAWDENKKKLYVLQGTGASYTEVSTAENKVKVGGTDKNPIIMIYTINNNNEKTEARFEGLDVKIKKEHISQVESAASKGYTPSQGAGDQLIMTRKVSETTSGKEGTPEVRKTTTITTRAFGQAGSYVSTETMTTNKAGNKIFSTRKITEYYAGYNLLGSEGQNLNGLIQELKVSLNKQGKLSGEIITYDKSTGMPVFFEDILSARVENGIIHPEVKTDLEKLDDMQDRFKNSQHAQKIEGILADFQGFDFIPSHFLKDKDWYKLWEEKVYQRASEWLGYPKEKTRSFFCDNPAEWQNEGLAVAEVPGGVATVAAHVEATRTKPITDETGKTIYLYKITFNVKNGESKDDKKAVEDMKSNLVLRNDRRDFQYFKQDKIIKKGQSWGRAGATAGIRYSPSLYDKVCLTFNEVPGSWKKLKENDAKKKELCNKIQELSEEPTLLRRGEQATPDPDEAEDI